MRRPLFSCKVGPNIVKSGRKVKLPIKADEIKGDPMEKIFIDFDKEIVSVDDEAPEHQDGLKSKEEQVCVLLKIDPPLPHKIRIEFERKIVFYDDAVRIDPDLPFLMDSLIDILGYDVYDGQEILEILDKLYNQLLPPGLFQQDPELFTKKAYGEDELRDLLRKWDNKSDQ